jgi:alpha-1,3-fucosyltransferase 10
MTLCAVAMCARRTFSSVAALHAEVLRLTRDRAAWEAKVAWRRRPVAELSAPYRHLVRHHVVS